MKPKILFLENRDFYWE